MHYFVERKVESRTQSCILYERKNFWRSRCSVGGEHDENVDQRIFISLGTN